MHWRIISLEGRADRFNSGFEIVCVAVYTGVALQQVMSKLEDFGDLDDLHLLDGLSLQEIEELSEAIDPEVRKTF